MKFPYEESHYGRERTKKRYLSAELCVRRMYVMFVEENFPEKYRELKEKDVQPEKFDCVIKYKFSLNILKNILIMDSGSQERLCVGNVRN